MGERDVQYAAELVFGPVAFSGLGGTGGVGEEGFFLLLLLEELVVRGAKDLAGLFFFVLF